VIAHRVQITIRQMNVQISRRISSLSMTGCGIRRSQKISVSFRLHGSRSWDLVRPGPSCLCTAGLVFLCGWRVSRGTWISTLGAPLPLCGSLPCPLVAGSGSGWLQLVSKSSCHESNSWNRAMVDVFWFDFFLVAGIVVVCHLGSPLSVSSSFYSWLVLVLSIWVVLLGGHFSLILFSQTFSANFPIAGTSRFSSHPLIRNTLSMIRTSPYGQQASSHSSISSGVHVQSQSSVTMQHESSIVYVVSRFLRVVIILLRLYYECVWPRMCWYLAFYSVAYFLCLETQKFLLLTAQDYSCIIMYSYLILLFFLNSQYPSSRSPSVGGMLLGEFVILPLHNHRPRRGCCRNE